MYLKATIWIASGTTKMANCNIQIEKAQKTFGFWNKYLKVVLKYRACSVHVGTVISNHNSSGENSSSERVCHFSNLLSTFFRVSNQCRNLSPLALMPNWTPPTMKSNKTNFLLLRPQGVRGT